MFGLRRVNRRRKHDEQLEKPLLCCRTTSTQLPPQKAPSLGAFVISGDLFHEQDSSHPCRRPGIRTVPRRVWPRRSRKAARLLVRSAKRRLGNQSGGPDEQGLMGW